MRHQPGTRRKRLLDSLGSVFLTAFALTSARAAWPAQEEPQSQEAAPGVVVTVALKDGTSLVGRIVEQDAISLTVLTLGGLNVQVPRPSVVSVTEAPPSQRVDRRFSRSDPNDSRLMFAPTARPLRKGSGSFSDHYVLFPGVSYGVTAQLSLSGGVSVAPGVSVSEQLFYGSAKIGVEVKKDLALAGGVAYAGGGGDGDAAAIAFAVATLGRPSKSVTAGVGFGGSRNSEYDFRTNSHRDEWKWRDKPVLMVGGSVQLSNSLALLTENWFILGNKLSEQPLGVAIRFFGGRISADVGLILVGEVIEEGFPIPWLSFSYHFGRSRDKRIPAPSLGGVAFAPRLTSLRR